MTGRSALGGIDEPSPTIVGPRPLEDATGRKVNVPRGIERLVTLAGLNAEWREKVLADPLAAAREAEIELAESEQAILRSVPPVALAGMIDSVAKTRAAPVSADPRFLKEIGGLQTASGPAKIAAAALLAASLVAPGCESPVATAGVRRDVPPSRPATQQAAPAGAVPVANVSPAAARPAPAVAWQTSLDDALAEARKANRAVMAAFVRVPQEAPPQPMVPMAGVAPRLPQQDPESVSNRVVHATVAGVRDAVQKANVIAARLMMPVRPPGVLTADQRKKYDDACDAYEALLKKYTVEKFPTVVFIAPDGAVLARAVQPADDTTFVAALRLVPGFLATWLTANRLTTQSRPATSPVSKGERADIPPPREFAGVRPDAPR